MNDEGESMEEKNVGKLDGTLESAAFILFPVDRFQ
jgi:hypothetical protein